MGVNAARLIYYSPTGSSRRIAEAVASGLALDYCSLDLTKPGGWQPTDVGSDNVAVISVPVYGGRVAATAAERLQRVRGAGGPAALITVYGNRAYEDALLELKDISIQQGFTPVAAAAFIAEHSFSTRETPIARGRPDFGDLEKAAAFGSKIRARLGWAGGVPDLFVPGGRPYRERGAPSECLSPETDADKCILCGACMAACPTGAISLGGAVTTLKGACTRCTACVKTCPTGARSWTHPGIRKAAAWLYTNFSARREPEFFL